MNRNLSEIVFVLDRSGSMSSVAHAAIAGFNQFLEEQQSAPGSARLTLVLFDDEYLVPINAIPIAEAVPLDFETYVPRNTTALLDAIGRTIDEFGARLAQTSERDRPGTVIVAILTDGLENASTHYTWKQVSRRIKHQREKYRWQFLFLGANQDAIATSAQLNIAADAAATWQADSAGGAAGFACASRKSRAMRAAASGVLTPQESADLSAPLQQLVAEEDKNQRRKKR